MRKQLKLVPNLHTAPVACGICKRVINPDIPVMIATKKADVPVCVYCARKHDPELRETYDAIQEHIYNLQVEVDYQKEVLNKCGKLHATLKKLLSEASNLDSDDFLPF